MNGLENWREVMLESFRQVGGGLAGIAPKVLAALVILAVGWGVSKLVEKICARALRRFGLDRAADQLGVSSALEQAGIRSGASGVLGRLLFWILLLAFLLPALETMGLTAVASTVDRLITYLPNVLAAALLLVVGALAARFVRNVTSSAAAVASVGPARQLGAIAGGLVVAVVAVLALEQLGVETRFLIVVVTTLAATIGLSVGIALALGASKAVAHIFAGHFLRQSLQVGERVEVRGQVGVVDRIGAVDTVFREGKEAWSVPNGALLEERIGR